MTSSRRFQPSTRSSNRALEIVAAALALALVPLACAKSTDTDGDGGTSIVWTTGGGGSTTGGSGGITSTGGTGGSTSTGGTGGSTSTSGTGGSTSTSGTGGASSSSSSSSSSSGTTTYSHTIVIDGVNDFTLADEQLSTSSNGFAGYIAWDSQNLYVGMDGTDFATPSQPTKWVLVYVSGSPGLTVGQPYNTQEPNLPFTAGYHIRWKLDANETNNPSMRIVSGGAWTAGSFTGDASWSTAGSYVEISIPLADIGGAGLRSVHVNMINEQSMVESSWAALPASSFTNGYDPDYAKCYQFDLGGQAVPSSYPPAC